MSHNTERRQYRLRVVVYTCAPSGQAVHADRPEPFGPYFTMSSVKAEIRKAEKRVRVKNDIERGQRSGLTHTLRTEIQYRDPDWCDFRPGLTPDDRFDKL